MNKRKIKIIQWTLNLPMDFPEDWNDEMIKFHLNESSWCCNNLIDKLQEYSKNNGCICSICTAEIKGEKYNGRSRNDTL